MGIFLQKHIKAELALYYFFLLLAISIPLSTTLTTCVGIICIILCIYLWGHNFSHYVSLVANNIVAIMAAVMFSIFLIGCLYAEYDFTVLRMLNKMGRLLLIPLFVPIFAFYTHRKRNIINAFIICMVVVGVIQILRHQLYLKLGIEQLRSCMRNELIKDRIFNGLFFNMAAFMVLHDQRLKTYVKIIAVSFFVYCLFYANNSIVGYFLLAILSCLYVVQKWNYLSNAWKIGLLVAIVTLCIALINFNTKVNARMVSVKQDITSYLHGNEIKESIGLRLEFLQRSWRIIKSNPSFGVGTGGFAKAYRKQLLAGEQQLLTHQPHNEYINITVQLGIFGLLIFLIFLGTLWYKALYLAKNDKHIAQGIILSLVIGCLANSWLFDFTSSCFFVLFIALLFSTPISTKNV